MCKKLLLFALLLPLLGQSQVIYSFQQWADGGSFGKRIVLPRDSTGHISDVVFIGSTLYFLGGDGVYHSLVGSSFTQVQTDWNASSGIAAILHKPNISAIGLSGNFIDLASHPNSLSGYGIIDAVDINQIYNDPTWLNSLHWDKVTGFKGDSVAAGFHTLGFYDARYGSGGGISDSGLDVRYQALLGVPMLKFVSGPKRFVLYDTGFARPGAFALNADVWKTRDSLIALNNATFLKAANALSELVGSAATARTNLGLGTAAVKDVPASGDASSTQVVLGNDSRLTNQRDAGSIQTKAVSTTAPTNGQVLAWNNSTLQYEPVTPAGGGGSVTGFGPFVSGDTVYGPQEVGIEYDKTGFTSISPDFTENTGSFTVSSSMIQTTAGVSSTDTTKYIGYKEVAYDERHIEGYEFIAPTKTATSYICAIGPKTISQTHECSWRGGADLGTDGNAGKVSFVALNQARIFSANAITWSAGDSMRMETERDVDTVYIRLINLMAARRNMVSLKYILSTGNPQSTGSPEAANRFAIWTQGDPHAIYRVYKGSHDLMFANTMWVGDSKMQGFTTSDFFLRFADRSGRYYGTYLNYGMTGAKIEDVIALLPNMIKKHPRQIINNIGSNNTNPDATFQSNWTSLRAAWAVAKIRDITLSMSFETARNLDNMFDWQKANSGNRFINIYDAGRGGLGTFIASGDGIHLTARYNDSIFYMIIRNPLIWGGRNSMANYVEMKGGLPGDIPMLLNSGQMTRSPLNYLGDSVRGGLSIPWQLYRIVVSGGANPAIYFVRQSTGAVEYFWADLGGVMTLGKFAGSSTLFATDLNGNSAVPGSMVIGSGSPQSVRPLLLNLAGSTVQLESDGQVIIKNPTTGTFAAWTLVRQFDNSTANGTTFSHPGANSSVSFFNITVGATGDYRFGDAAPGIGVGVTPTAYLHVGAGSSTRGSLKFDISPTGGVVTPQDGLFEYYNTSSVPDLWFTMGSTKFKLTNQGGMTNPMTTTGDIITGGASGAPARLAIGSNGQHLEVVSGALAYKDANTSWGAYLPTVSGGGTVTTVNADSCHWTRSGPIVTVRISGTITFNATGTNASITWNPPFTATTGTQSRIGSFTLRGFNTVLGTSSTVDLISNVLTVLIDPNSSGSSQDYSMQIIYHLY